MKKISISCILVLMSIVNAALPSATNDKELFEVLDLMALNTLTNTIAKDDIISKLEKLHNAGYSKASWYYMNAITRSDYSKANKIGKSIFPDLLKLAQNNDTLAAMMVISFYRFGIGDVKKDHAQAVVWRKKYSELQKKEMQKDMPDPIIILNNVASNISSGKIPNQKELEYLKSCGSKYAVYIYSKIKTR